MVASADFILACGARAGVAMRDIAPRSEATGTASDRILAAAKEMGLSA